MKEENTITTVMSKVDPDLCAPPHILPVLMELLGGDSQQDLSQQDQLFSHLATCHYCRTAVVFLLNVAQEYDRRNNDSEEPTRDLLMRFESISREAEAREARNFERMGAYADAVVAEGQERAAQRFPDVAAHLRICPDCCLAVKATVASITESEESN
jgi:hypothetical protein